MKRIDVLLIRSYVIYTVLEPIWMGICPEVTHFFGASSLIYLFQFSLGNGRGIASYLSLMMMGTLFVGIAVSFLFEEKKKIIGPFLLFVGIDLVISIGIIVYKIVIHNYLDICLALIGWGVRSLFFLYLLHFQCLRGTRENTRDIRNTD